MDPIKELIEAARRRNNGGSIRQCLEQNDVVEAAIAAVEAAPPAHFTHNANHKARIVLRERGVIPWNAYHNNRPPAKAGDTVEEQVHTIINIFGDLFFMGPDPPIDTVIEYIDAEQFPPAAAWHKRPTCAGVWWRQCDGELRTITQEGFDGLGEYDEDWWVGPLPEKPEKEAETAPGEIDITCPQCRSECTLAPGVMQRPCDCGKVIDRPAEAPPEPEAKREPSEWHGEPPLPKDGETYDCLCFRPGIKGPAYPVNFRWNKGCWEFRLCPRPPQTKWLDWARFRMDGAQFHVMTEKPYPDPPEAAPFRCPECKTTPTNNEFEFCAECSARHGISAGAPWESVRVTCGKCGGLLKWGGEALFGVEAWGIVQPCETCLSVASFKANKNMFPQPAADRLFHAAISYGAFHDRHADKGVAEAYRELVLSIEHYNASTNLKATVPAGLEPPADPAEAIKNLQERMSESESRERLRGDLPPF